MMALIIGPALRCAMAVYRLKNLFRFLKSDLVDRVSIQGGRITYVSHPRLWGRSLYLRLALGYFIPEAQEPGCSKYSTESAAHANNDGILSLTRKAETL